ncbi:MAG: DUF6512 family protein [Acutalibacteraceae bacterium]|nr:DUF6512 family protein [Acutalibacteraceae bacterium]
MFNKKIWLIGGIIFSVALGVLLHFVYEWSGENKIAGYFSAVNESTWEHLKLLFIPVLIFSIFEWLLRRKSDPKFLLARTISLIIAMVFIVVTFYTVSGIVGKTDMPVINIGIFVVSVIITFLLTEIISKCIFNVPENSNVIAIVILFILGALFVLWTYNPLNIGLFKNP